MATSQCRSALVASVAKALSFAISDPTGHTSWALSQKHESPCKRRRGITETQRSATVFDSSSIPPIGIDKYLMRLSANFKCSDASFIAAFIVVDRLLEYDGGRLPLTEQNVHRIFFASLVVSVKYHEDLVYSNSHYAKAGGVHLREVNRMERTLLAALDFDLRISPEQYQTYEAALIALHGGSPQTPLQKPDGGEPHKPQAQGAVTPDTCAGGLSSTLTVAQAAVNPPSSTLSEATSREAEVETTPTVAPSRAAVVPTPVVAQRRRTALRPTAVNVNPGGYICEAFYPKPGFELQTCAPWVMHPDRALFEFGVAVPASQ